MDKLDCTDWHPSLLMVFYRENRRAERKQKEILLNKNIKLTYQRK